MKLTNLRLTGKEQPKKSNAITPLLMRLKILSVSIEKKFRDLVRRLPSAHPETQLSITDTTITQCST